MVTRVSAFILFAAVLCSSPVLAGGDHGDVSPVERTCQFQLEVEPILRVSPCFEIRDNVGVLLVETNTRTIVCFENTNFTRRERDCDGDPLRTVDTIPGRLGVRFLETPHCAEGAPLEVKDLEGDCWCVNPHRGGYAILLVLRPGESDICDDAGCYVAEVKVTITAEPFEECP